MAATFAGAAAAAAEEEGAPHSRQQRPSSVSSRGEESSSTYSSSQLLSIALHYEHETAEIRLDPKNTWKQCKETAQHHFGLHQIAYEKIQLYLQRSGGSQQRQQQQRRLIKHKDMDHVGKVLKRGDVLYIQVPDTTSCRSTSKRQIPRGVKIARNLFGSGGGSGSGKKRSNQYRESSTSHEQHDTSSIEESSTTTTSASQNYHHQHYRNDSNMSDLTNTHPQSWHTATPTTTTPTTTTINQDDAELPRECQSMPPRIEPTLLVGESINEFAGNSAHSQVVARQDSTSSEVAVSPTMFTPVEASAVCRQRQKEESPSHLDRHNPRKPTALSLQTPPSPSRGNQNPSVTEGSTHTSLDEQTPQQAARRRPTLTELPHNFRCPVMHYLMADPVIDEEGYTYDRENIEKCLAAAEDHSTMSETSSSAAAALLLRSPMTRNLISKNRLVPNRSVEAMIVDAVQKGEVVLSTDDLEDWRRRRREKLIRDRARSSSVGSGDIPQTVAVRYPVTLLARLVRWDRQNHDQLFGPNDSGLSVALASAPARSSSSSNNALSPTAVYCSVTCCISPLTDNVLLYDCCDRCQRTVCHECRRIEVSEFTREHAAAVKPTHTICIECVWQIADVLATMDEQDRQRARLTHEQAHQVRRDLLHRHVAPRVTDVFQQARQVQQETIRQEALANSQCVSLAREITAIQTSLVQIDKYLEATRKDFLKDLEYSRRRFAALSEFARHLQFLHHQLNGILASSRDEVLISDTELAQWQDANSSPLLDVDKALEFSTPPTPLPLSLRYPSPAMQGQVQELKRQLQAFVGEKRPLVQAQVYQDQSRLHQIRDELAGRVSLKNKQRERIQKLSELLQQLDNKFTEFEKQERTPEVSVSLLADELERTLPSMLEIEEPLEGHSSTNNTAYIRMCPVCQRVPVEEAAAAGCPQCSSSGQLNSQEWPLWDGGGWFH